MDTTDLLTALERDGAALLDDCLAAAPGTRVAACPAWDVDDLLWHVTEVHAFWREVVARRALDPTGIDEPPRPTGDALATAYRDGLARLVTTLREAEPATEVWTWSDQRDVAFVIRRMALETAVHGWDASVAAGRARPIEAELASDGVDEFLHRFTGRPVDGARLDGSVHLHCTDVAGEWTCRLVDGVVTTTREHAKGDAAMRGPADVLLRALWRRAPLSEVDVVGDAAVAAQFVAWTNLS